MKADASWFPQLSVALPAEGQAFNIYAFSGDNSYPNHERLDPIRMVILYPITLIKRGSG